MKKKLLFLIITVSFIININIIYAESTNKPNINEGSCILIDSKTGRVLYEHNPNAKGLYPASTTKILTAIIAIEKGDLNQVMTASQSAVNDIGKDGTNIGIMTGEEIKLEDLLRALLISSANETANIIAENICSTRQEFIDLMNKKAKELGALDTNFVNPCGAHNSNHYTTASDLAKIARYAMTLPKFREIVCMDKYQLPPTNKHKEWPVLATTNKFMQYNKSDIYNIIGIKSGFTVPAGYNLVSAAVNDDGMELISVVMDVKNDGARNNVKKYSKELLDYGFNNFSLVTFLKNNQVYRSVDVKDSQDNSKIDLVAKGDFKYVLPNDKSSWNVVEVPSIRTPISAPVNEGDVLGYIDYQINGKSIGKVDLIASRSVKLNLQGIMSNKLKSVFSLKFIFVICIIAISFLLLRVVLRRVSRKVRSRRY